MSVTINHHGDGQADVVVRLTASEVAALRGDMAALAVWFDGVLGGLATVRTGRAVRDGQGDRPATVRDLTGALAAADPVVLSRLEGLRDVAIDHHADLRGDLGDLAAAMGVSRCVARPLRMAVLTRTVPTEPERWAAAAVRVSAVA